MNEQWKSIPGYEGFYEASTMGRIRSVDRIVLAYNARGRRLVEQKRQGKILIRANPDKTGYLTTCLCRDGKSKTKRVNSLICAAFHGPAPAGMICCHWDGNKLNNKPDNLRWDTHKANQEDRLRHGTDLRGSEIGTAKLSTDQVAEIRAGMRQKDALRKFGIGKSQFYRIKRGESWAHV